VGVGAAQGDGAVRRRVLEDRADVDARLVELRARLVGREPGVVATPGLPTVDLVVSRDDDVVEVDVDGDAGLRGLLRRCHVADPTREAVGPGAPGSQESQRNRGSNGCVPALAHSDGSPVRALVVDDEELLADMLRMALRSEGW